MELDLPASSGPYFIMMCPDGGAVVHEPPGGELGMIGFPHPDLAMDWVYATYGDIPVAFRRPSRADHERHLRLRLHA